MRVRVIYWALMGLLFTSTAHAADRDGDLLEDDEELRLGTDPDVADTDGGGRLDGHEVYYDGTDPLDFEDDLEDSDGDDLSDQYESDLGTDPDNPDSDEDGLDDGVEVMFYESDPQHPDTDGDRLEDGAEVHEHGTDLLLEDTDGDGLDDCLELFDTHTEPITGDSDGDGVLDADELADSTDPIGTTSWCDSAPVIATDAIEVTCVADETYAVVVTASDDHSYVTSIYAHPALPDGEPYSSVAVLDKETEARLAREYRFSGDVTLPGTTCDDLVVIRFTAVNARGNTSRSAWWSGDPPPSPCSAPRFDGTETLQHISQVILDVGDAYYSSLTALGDTDGDGITELAATDGETTLVLTDLPAVVGGRDMATSFATHTVSGQSCATVGAVADPSGTVQLLTGDWCALDFEGQVDVRDPVSGAIQGSYTGASGGGLDMFGQSLPTLNQPGLDVLSSDFIGGDGVADLVVGVPRYNDWSGTVVLFAGPLSGGTLGSADVTLDSGTDGGYSELGNNVGSGGDLNGDGIDDLILSRTFFTNSYRPADVLVLDGPIPTGSYSARDLAMGRVYVDQSISYTATQPGGDLDNDGYGDLLVSDHAYADTDDRVAVFLGPIASDMELDSAAMSVRGDGLGFEPSFRVGDLDGDRIPDLVVGNPASSGAGGAYSGEVGILYGPIPSGVVGLSSFDALLEGNSAYGYAGQGVVVVGDIAGTGEAHLLVTVDGDLWMPLVP